MNKKKKLLLTTVMFLVILFLGKSFGKDYSDKIKKIEIQLLKKIEIFDGRWPEYTVNGVWKYRKNVNWFSGFAAGELFMMNEITSNEKLFKNAVIISDILTKYATINYTHDMGFIFLHSVVNAYRKTGDKKYREAGLEAAKMLAKRFNEKGNFIRAWGELDSNDRPGLMIIDTMLNLELLFWAAREFGIPEFYDIAYKHALVCLNEHVRDDFSSFHVVEFNPNSGEIIKKYTHQGFADSSTWARGQAWGIYGFAQVYKNTGDIRFLNASKKMADYFLENLPDDYVPHWDLDITGENLIRDASAGAIAASGMSILAEQCQTKENYKKYISAADKITESLVENYTFLNSKRNKEEGILIHTVYNYNAGWGIDESFPCGDFYFIEALNKYIKRNHVPVNTGNIIRQRINLNDNWFYLEDNISFLNLSKSASNWERIDLPHSWNKFDAVDQEPGYRRDAGWYQKEIILQELNPDEKYKLEFEAVNIKSEVYVNNNFVGRHIGGYIGFEYDITKYLKIGENIILVRADNSIDRSVIPSQKSDFFIFGGIPRDVWLNVVPAENLNSLKITALEVNENLSKVEVSFNADLIPDNSSADIKIINPDGKIISELKKDIAMENKFILPEINNPQLWSTDSPKLYSVKIELSSGGKLIDEISESFGLRWFEFKEHGGFYLNGKRLKLRGTHRHEEFAGMANAIPNELHKCDMKMIKEMGANFVRLAHYPQDPVVYKSADELGLLIWDELPWCRGGVGDETWQQNTKNLLREQINQNYNHPSIIIWSIGNEVYWLPDYDSGGDIEKLREFAGELNDIAHTLDPHRLTSIRKFYEGADIVDVFSPSIWAGWYSGVYKSYEKAIDGAIAKYNKFFHAEYGGSSHLGRHSEFPITGDGMLNPDEWTEAVNQVKVDNVAKIGDWSENYIVDLFDWHLMVSETNDDFSGNAQWAFKDFGTPLRPENSLPYINQKGLVDREGKPKDAYYVFKSYWNNTDKFIYIESHTWTDRYGAANEKRNISVYSNCSQVELFLNGISLGKKEKIIKEFPASGLNWDVNFADGKNELIAKNKIGKVEISDTLYINYYYEKIPKPEEIVLSSQLLPNSNYLITAKVVDSSGKLCVDFDERVYFSTSGSGKLIENYGTYTKSSVIEFADGKAQIEFKKIPFEKCTIEARTQDFKGSYLTIE